MSESAANRHLIGEHRVRARISTPALILDLDRLEANIRTMASFCRRAGVHLRPHVKCHKSVEIARRQIEAGAVGVCCATIAEAEVMGRGGISNILITSPLTTAEKIRRFCELSRRIDWLAVVVDHPANVHELASAARSAQQRLRVLVDLDGGMRRTGVSSREASVQLILECSRSQSLEFQGIQCYDGLAQHERHYESRCERVSETLATARAVRADVRALGYPAQIVTGGGTGTLAIDAQLDVLNELQPGSYLFMDVQYQQLELAPGEARFEQSLFVQASVISANHPACVTIDAGLKQFAVDGGVPIVASGAPSNAAFSYMGDEHGLVTFAPGAEPPPLGSRIEFVIPHCDPTVNLYNHFHCFRGQTLVDIWPVDARGS